jgi:hypothetical protein
VEASPDQRGGEYLCKKISPRVPANRNHGTVGTMIIQSSNEVDDLAPKHVFLALQNFDQRRSSARQTASSFASSPS